ncbi:MAG: hypothetical protein V2I24_14245 [Halieaceae bacterium]|nr:hypothetical protein [Halieaceae bacterium]
MTTPAILPIGESRRLNRLRMACSIAPPGLWLAAVLFSTPTGLAANLLAGLALGAVASLLREICRRLDPKGQVLVVTDRETALAAQAAAAATQSAPSSSAGYDGADDGGNKGCLDSVRPCPLQVAADLRCAIWLLPMRAPTTNPALLLCGDALGETRWRDLRQRLALGSTLWLLDQSAPRGLTRTVSLPTASVSG